jgi:hypothetical protein
VPQCEHTIVFGNERSHQNDVTLHDDPGAGDLDLFVAAELSVLILDEPRRTEMYWQLPTDGSQNQSSLRTLPRTVSTVSGS